MTQTLVNTYNIANDHRIKLTYTLFVGCFFMIAVYVFNVYKVISSTVVIQKIDSQSVAMESNVQNIDSKYIELSSQITPDVLAGHGFTPGKVSAYIPRNASLGSVAIGGHEL